MKDFYTIYPIGIIHKSEQKVEIEIFDKYLDALTGLDDFSHIHVLYWFDKNDNPEQRNLLKIHPRKNPNNPLTGVFATHAPVRPNLIGVTPCKILSIKDNLITIDGIDAYDGSPVIDIKCYIPDEPPKEEIKTPSWLRD